MHRILLGEYPTPVASLPTVSLPGTAVWVKHDDVSAALYGGNKVRKLEYVLGDARARGASTLVTLGAVGSHHVLATATYGRRHGFHVRAVLIPQPATDHARANARAELAQGLEAIPSRQIFAPLAIARAMGPSAYFVQVGGSSVLGAMGYVDGARELVAQARAGQLPLPDLVVVTLGSGGTVAGLVAGLALEEVHTRVLGVCVVDPPRVFIEYARLLARRCARAAGGRLGAKELAARLETTTRFVGRGYGHATEEGRAAIRRAEQEGLTLDLTYTAKTFAALLSRVEAGREKNILFWHTLSSAPMEPLLAGAPPKLPRELERLLRPT
jgi:1-aminocyclopropane-1-carboxylate deaminase/D-cysteine desulfhydrase-like pyridoxal-dependent ACC family enzyme